MKMGEKKILKTKDDLVSWRESLQIDFDLENKELLEDFNLVIYLYALIEKEIIKFAIEITKNESPDFVIKQIEKGNLIGLEFTHTTIPFHFKNLKEAKKIPGSKVEISHDRSYLRKPGEPLSCRPFYGNQAEITWCSFIKETFKKKLENLNKPHFNSYQKNVLLIRNFTGFPIKMDVLFGLISKMGKELIGNDKTEFNEISIIWGDRKIYQDITNECKEIEIFYAT